MIFIALLAAIGIVYGHEVVQDRAPLVPDMKYARAVGEAFRIVHESYPLRANAVRCVPKLTGLLYRIDGMQNKDIAEANRELRELGCLDRFSTIGASPIMPPIRCEPNTTVVAKDPAIPARIYRVGRSDTVVLHVYSFQWEPAPCTVYELEILRMAGNLRKKLEGSKFRRLILDLRGNPGGDAWTVREFVTELFSPQVGTPLVTYRSRGFADQEWHTRRKGAFRCPNAVLIDRYTASGAEMTAGILRAWCPRDKTLFVGEMTYKKGTVMDSRRAGEAHVYVSTWEFFIGVGDNLIPINDVGITPDIRPPSLSPLFESKHLGMYLGRTLGLDAWSGVLGTGDQILNTALFALYRKERAELVSNPN